MDSDGCFSMVRYKKAESYHAINPMYGLRATVGQTSPNAVVIFQEFFGGILTTRPSRSRGGKELCLWIGNASHAAICAEALLPYLQIKRRQAELILEMATSLGRPKGDTTVRGEPQVVRGQKGREVTRQYRQLSQEVVEERKGIFRAFQAAQRELSNSACQQQVPWE